MMTYYRERLIYDTRRADILCRFYYIASRAVRRARARAEMRLELKNMMMRASTPRCRQHTYGAACAA